MVSIEKSTSTDEKDHHLLISELQALVVEAKRRHPDVKDVGLAILRRQTLIVRPARKHWRFSEVVILHKRPLSVCTVHFLG